MLRNIILGIICLFVSVGLFAQNSKSASADTFQIIKFPEVIVISTKSVTDMAIKPLATLDSYLETASTVNMLRRGSYAWEPFINNMSSERSVISIDGMRIYGACTDKMDPVTSYVEITNLEKANIHNGQCGATGATIAGSLDLVRKKSFFGNSILSGTMFSGFETNNQQKIIGSALSYSGAKLFTDIDFTFRDAGNYKAGGAENEEILYSQFTKYNLSAIAGYLVGENQHIEASVIYDRAIDVGYPALPMDVSLAKALIASIEYVRYHLSPLIHQWQTKFYYNDITHIMDDSKRPDVPVRMDMPGWSTTIGFYTLLQGANEKHSWKANFSGHHNKSLAEMTMYSNNPEEKDMFMLTWPGVYTNYLDFYVEDNYHFATNWAANLNAGIAIHQNMVYSDFGLKSLQIFFPDIDKNNTRFLKRVAVSLEYQDLPWNYDIGFGYGERAPSVSEGYGFYLFNSFDRYDYIGNPKMRNEKSIAVNSGISFTHDKFSAKLSASYFYITDFIIGIPHSKLSSMTIGAAGVKIYQQIANANILNLVADLNYHLTENLVWSNNLSYSYGIGDSINTLPLLQPFMYSSKLGYYKNTFSAEASFDAATEKHKFNIGFGELAVPPYSIVNLSASYRFVFIKQTLLLKIGAENLFDKKYTTFADWNRLLRMGRNFYLNLVWTF